MGLQGGALRSGATAGGIVDELPQWLGLEEGPPETQRCLPCRRPFNSEPKIPYVRLERLKICAASSGEMPVFKLKPQKNEQDGSFLLIIECGTESSSMSIKVPLCSLWSWSLAPPGASFLSAAVRILPLALALSGVRSEWGCSLAGLTPGCEGVCPSIPGAWLAWAPGISGCPGLVSQSSPSLHNLLVLCSDCRLPSSPRSARTTCPTPSRPQVWGEERSLSLLWLGSSHRRGRVPLLRNRDSFLGSLEPRRGPQYQ